MEGYNNVSKKHHAARSVLYIGMISLRHFLFVVLIFYSVMCWFSYNSAYR